MRVQYESLTIRDAEIKDAKQLTAWWNDGAVMAHAGFPNGLGTTEEKVIAGLQEGRLVLEENGRLIGEACYKKVAEGVAEIGIKICETDCQNRGLGRVFLSMLLRYLFNSGYHKIVLDTNLTNKRAQHVYESLGFRKLRVNIDSWTDQLGNKRSSVDYELIEREFVDHRTKHCFIKNINAFEDCCDFVRSFCGDPDFSAPMLSSEEQLRNNLIRSMEKPETHTVWGVFRGGEMIGLFSFLILPDEKYMEMLVGLSRDEAVYRRVFQHLEQNYPGYDADFVFNPRNQMLRETLAQKGADFDTEQQKMQLNEAVLDADTSGVEMYAPEYAQQYFNIHNKNMYWTGEKVAAATELFRTLLAVCDGAVVGYIDVTHCFHENEPFDLFVLPDYRRKGFGRKLLAKALELNQPSSMMLQVDVDNTAAIALYESMGFEKVRNQNSMTAHWKIAAPQ